MSNNELYEEIMPNNELYGELMMEHVHDPYHLITMPDRYKTFESGRLRSYWRGGNCGDNLRLELEMRDRQIVQAFFEQDGCAVTRAASSILMQNIEGLSVEEALKFSCGNMLEVFSDVPFSRRGCLFMPVSVLHDLLHDFLHLAA